MSNDLETELGELNSHREKIEQTIPNFDNIFLIMELGRDDLRKRMEAVCNGNDLDEN